MAKVPMFKNNTGMRVSQTFSDGDYHLRCQTVSVSPDKKDALTDLWIFKFDTLTGPPLPTGKPAKGQTYTEFVRIVQPGSANYKPEWDDPESGKTQMGVDQLKSMATAMGVKGRGDDVNPTAFAGCEALTHIIVTKGKDQKDYNRGVNWRPVVTE